MEVRARSFRGFSIIGAGISQATVDRAREQVEALMEKDCVTAAQIGTLRQKMMDIGIGVDLAQFTDADWRRYGVDPKLVKVNKRIHNALSSIRKLNAEIPGSVLGFKAEV